MFLIYKSDNFMTYTSIIIIINKKSPVKEIFCCTFNYFSEDYTCILPSKFYYSLNK